MSSPREWKAAIRDVFGPVYSFPISPASTIASATGEGIISGTGLNGVSTGTAYPALLWGFGYSVTAANTAIDFRLCDASATAIGTPVKFNIKTLAAGTKSVFFDRPIAFDKGIVWVISATGAALPQLEIFWEPRSRANLGLI